MKIFSYLVVSVLISLFSGCLLTAARGILTDSEVIQLDLGLNGIMGEPNYELEISLQEQESGQTTDSIIEEQVVNGSFNQDLEFWDYWGDAAVVELNTNKYIQLGFKHSSNLVQQNCIQQTLTGIQTPHFLSFDIWQFTDEEQWVFDAAGLIVFIDEQPIFIKESVNTDGWLPVIARLPVLQTGEHELKICAGNSGDRINGSWVYVDNITTAAAAVSENSILSLNSSAQDITLQAEYELNSGYKLEQEPWELNLMFLEKIQNNSVKVSLLNQNQEVLLNQEVKVYFLNQPPLQAQALTIEELEADRYLLSFADNDYPAHEIFEVFAAESVPAFENEEELCRAELFQPPLSMDLFRPNCFDNSCLLTVDLAGCQLESPWISISVCDPALNCSGLTEPVFAAVQEASPTPTPAQISNPEILINEIMFNPEGDDAGENLEGEWIELFNPSQIVLDLADWSILDKVDNKVLLSEFNSCNNLQELGDILENGCSIAIHPSDYLVIFIPGSPILNNSGDELRLLDAEGKTVDQISYPGSSVEGKTYGRIPDGADTWQPRLPATPFSPNLEE